MPDSNSDPGSPRVRPLCSTADVDTPEAQAAIAAAFPEPGPDDLASLAIGPDLRAALVDAGVRTVGELHLALRPGETGRKGEDFAIGEIGSGIRDRELARQLGVTVTDLILLGAALRAGRVADPVPQADHAPAAVPGGPTPFEALVRAEVARQVEVRRASGRGEKMDLFVAWSSLDYGVKAINSELIGGSKRRNLSRVRDALVKIAAMAQRAAQDLGLVAGAGEGEEARP